ncbi:HIT-like protein [Dacryopinax primogenitus]|uniref:HIT-like protein n=1 Tax=Dacryopinax primogenitus (strain DJM 731) TaxID=1858805 RepID=M5G4S3_DACPD|nr:HIT-like protein [Dacryopinax primogenitus]EJU03220.1 HIT-like protein [Dacryopinax primogenitus]
MTSFMIDEAVNKRTPLKWTSYDTCPFCNIIANKLPAFRVLETDMVIAFLDILPIRPGHTLVVPKMHCSNLSDLPSDYSRAVGEALSTIANAITRGMTINLNVVCNQGYGQAVPHVHFHMVPAPRTVEPPSTQSPTNRSMNHHEMVMSEYHRREELDEDTGRNMADRIRSRL